MAEPATDVVGAGPEAPTAPPGARWVTPALVAAGVVGLVLVVALAVRVLTWDWWAVGDFGILRLRTLDVGTSHTPLVGVYSRWGWNHPGPLLFYALAPALRLTGGAGHGLLLGALMVNVAAVAAALWVAARVGRRELALTGLVVALMVVGVGTAELFDPWNPFVMVLPLFCSAVAAWRTAMGDRVAAVVLVVAASFAVQSHVAAGAPALTMVVVGGVGLGLRAVRGPERGHDRRSLLLAGAVAVACWIPALIQQFTTSPGNLSQLLDFFLHDHEPVNGWASGARAVSQVLGFPPQWIVGGQPSPHRPFPVPWALLALAVAAAWAWRRRWWSELVLCGVAVGFAAASLVGASRVSGVPYPYLFRWVWVAGAVTWLAVGVVVVAELRRFRWSWAIGPVLAGATAAVLLVLLVAGPDTSALQSSDTALRDFSSVLAPTMAALREAPGPTVVTLTQVGIDGSVGIEVLGRAESEGLDVRYPAADAYVVGRQRTIDPSAARSELVLASGDAQARYAADPRYHEVVSYDPLTPAERAEYERLAAIDWSARPDGPSNPGPEYRRYQQLSQHFESLTVFLADGPPPGS